MRSMIQGNTAGLVRRTVIDYINMFSRYDFIQRADSAIDNRLFIMGGYDDCYGISAGRLFHKNIYLNILDSTSLGTSTGSPEFRTSSSMALNVSSVTEYLRSHSS